MPYLLHALKAWAFRHPLTGGFRILRTPGLSAGDPVFCRPPRMVLVPINALSSIQMQRHSVGGIGLEPTASSMSTTRSSHLS